jgi:Soluble lytic murein transglycosylase and related regulatory proteins (some contain LysM/invasin domains)
MVNCIIRAKTVKKAAALILTAALIVGCTVVGVTGIKKRLYPKEYSEFVDKYCAMYEIDANLAYAVIHTESGFDSEAVSPLGACGLMQLMPDTFEWLRSKDRTGGERFSDIFDPETNIRYGVFFLSLIQRRFGSEQLVIAAYHAGMGRVSSWLGDSAFSSDGKSLHTIPFADTSHYVRKVERTKRIYDTLYASRDKRTRAAAVLLS